jgi:hypothetical protein
MKVDSSTGEPPKSFWQVLHKVPVSLARPFYRKSHTTEMRDFQIQRIA